MIAIIAGSDHWPSIRLHRALGFTRIGLLSAIGFKYAGWADMVLMQCDLGAGAATTPVETGG